ncbi:MAG: ATP-binding cassette domain-containing protein, partial [Gammaproteobacteria bacterium]
MDAAANSRVGENGASILPLQLRDVCYQIRGLRLIDAIDLTLDRPALTVVVGPNGAGKTLLLKLCHGLIAPTSGTIRWAHHSALSDPRAQAMVFQRPVMLRRSVSANVEYALKLCGVARAARAQHLRRVLELAGLTALAPRAARVLSGGEQQRLALAR